MIDRPTRPRPATPPLAALALAALALAALALAALALAACPATAGEYRYIFAVDGEPAAEETVHSENSGAAAKGPTTVWNSIDTRSQRTDGPDLTAADLAATPTAEVSVDAGSHLRRNATLVVTDARYGPGTSKLSMTQFMNNTGMGRPRPVTLADNNEGIGDPSEKKKKKGDGDGGEEDRFWEATTTGVSLNALYNEVLGRNIDPSGFKTYGELVDLKGKQLEEIREILLDSEEYRNKHPEASSTAETKLE